MKKVILPVVIAVFLLAVGLVGVSQGASPSKVPVAPVSPSQDATVSLVPQMTNVNVGGSFTVAVHVESGATELDSGEFYVNFDTTCLDITEIEATDAFAMDYGTVFDDAAGHADVKRGVAFVNPDYPSGSFDVAYLHFDAICEATVVFTWSQEALGGRYNVINSGGAEVAAEWISSTAVIITAPPPDTLTLAPPTQDMEAGSTADLTATALTGGSGWVGNIEFSSSVGTVSPTLVAADVNGQAVTTFSEVTQTQTVVVTATAGTSNTTASVVVVHAAAAASVDITPKDATVTGCSAATAYTLEAYDTYGNGPWGVTGSANFSIDAGAAGSWSGNEYTAGLVGTWDVIGYYDTGLYAPLAILSDTTTLTIERGAVASLIVATETVTAGQSVTYTVIAADGCGNEWDVTDTADFTITAGAGGSWTDNVYTAEAAGTWTVTVTYGGVEEEVPLTVNHDTAISVDITPKDATIKDNQTATFELAASDASSNSWSVTSAAVFAISDPSGAMVGNVYTPVKPDSVDTWVVTGTYGSLVDTTSLVVEKSTVFMTISDTVGGDIELDPTQPPEGYNPGDTITITAVPTYCYQFDGWTGDLASYGTQSPVVITATEDLSFGADFSLITYDALTVNVAPAGKGTVAIVPSSGPYICGQTVITATATATETTWTFDCWSGAKESTDNPVSFVLDEASGTVLTANFKQYKIFLPLVTRNY